MKKASGSQEHTAQSPLSLTITRIMGLLLLTFTVVSALSLASYYWLARTNEQLVDLVEAAGGLRTRANRLHWILNRAQLQPADFEYVRRNLTAIPDALIALAQG